MSSDILHVISVAGWHSDPTPFALVGFIRSGTYGPNDVLYHHQARIGHKRTAGGPTDAFCTLVANYLGIPSRNDRSFEKDDLIASAATAGITIQFL